MTRDELWAGTEASLETFLKAQEKSIEIKASDYDDDDDEKPHLLEVHGNVGVISVKGPLTNSDSFWNRLFGITSYNDIRAAVIAAVHVYRQRVRHLVDSGADLRADVYDAGLPPGFCADPVPYRRLLGHSAGAGFTVCSAVFRFPSAL